MSDDTLKSLLQSLTEEQKAKLMASLMYPDSNPDSDPEPEDEPPRLAIPTSDRPQGKTVVNSDFTVVRDNAVTAGLRQPVKAKPNQWKDIGYDSDPDFEAEKYEKLGRVARRKSGPKKVKIECHVCGKSFSANASTVYGEFVRCNRCTGR